MSPWSWAILLCTLVALFFSWRGNVQNYTKISSILLVAFLGTRLITEFVSAPRFMFDMSNDLAAVVLLVIFVKHSLVARGVMAMYAFMTTFAYIPSTLGYMPIHLHHIIVDMLAFVQIFILFGGIIHGYRNSNRQSDRMGVLAHGGGNSGVIHNSRPDRPSSPGNAQNSDVSKEDGKKVATYGTYPTNFWKPR